ncbi:MAG: SH3 domain-containing protein, partial [Planctomycetaceae bacterium]
MLVTPRRRARWLAPLILVITTLVIAPSGLLMPVPARADTDLTIGGEARVSYANGDDVRVRDQPSYDGSILTTVPEGWLVAIHDGPIDDGAGSFWYEVTARGTRGYIVSDFLADAGSSADTSSGDEVTAAAVATVSVNLRLRSAASLAASILLVIPRGATVNTTGATDNGFTQLTYQGTTGWSSSQYISSGGGAVISNAWVTGGALNLRSSPTTASTVILVMPNAAQVGVLGSAQDGFTPVRYNGADGWAYSQFLTASQPGSGATSTPGTVIGNAWVVGGALNLRSGPSTSNTVLLVMPNSAQVGVTGSPQCGFTPVRYNGTDGWAYSQFLSATAPGAT